MAEYCLITEMACSRVFLCFPFKAVCAKFGKLESIFCNTILLKINGIRQSFHWHLNYITVIGRHFQTIPQLCLIFNRKLTYFEESRAKMSSLIKGDSLVSNQ